MEPNNEKPRTYTPKDSKVSKQTHITEETSATGEKHYHCTACRKTFRSRSQKYYHLNCNHLQDMIYKCEHCDKSFARHSQWKYHVESHTSPINECPKCQKTFSNPLALKKHEALHKVEPKPCPHCDKKFQKKNSLDQHIAAQHLNQLQFGCAYCNKKYASKSTLHLHLQSHEKKRFDCSVCGKLFQRNSILNLHLKRHYHTNNFKCPVCQKIFGESGALSRHRKIHEENVLQYHCKLCNKSILRKDNMNRHLNTIHPEEKFEEIVEILRSSMEKSVAENMKDSGTEMENEFLAEIGKNNDNNDGVKIKNAHISSNEKCVIIENKIIQNPIHLLETEITNSSNVSEKLLPANLEFKCSDVRKNTNYKINFTDQPIVNKVQVITSVPINEQERISNDIDNASHELLQQQSSETGQQLEYATMKNFISDRKKQTTSTIQISHAGKCHQTPQTFDRHIELNSNSLFQESINICQSYPEKSRNQSDQISQEYDSYNPLEIQNYFVLSDNNNTKETKILNDFILKSSKTLHDTPTERSTIYGAPVTQTISSVIKSIGNVKKKVTPTIVTARQSTANIVTATKPTSNSLNFEYKHKKYCRNNYDIDLYRKILGCDDEDYNNFSENEQEDDSQQRKSIHTANNATKESATPVHWRKSFKNNYETSAS